MRKLKYIVCAVLCLCLLPLGGCKKQSDAPAADDTAIKIADFEQWAPDFQLMRVMENFGRVTKNEDERYVRSGKASAKLQILGGKSDTKLPLLYFPTASVLFEYDYTDFSKVESVDMWLYNAEAEEMHVTVGFVSAIVNAMEVNTMRGETFALAPGAWTRVRYFPARDILTITGDLDEIPGIYLEFENQSARELKDAAVLYLDDVTVTKNPELGEAPNIMTFADDVVLDFEQTWHKYAMYAKASSLKCKADVSVVKFAEYGVTGLQGDYALRVVTHPGDLFEASYPGIVIPEKVMRACGIMDVPQDDWAKTALEFDVYNNSDRTMRFFVEPGSKTTGRTFGLRCEVNAKSKLHYRVPFAHIEAQNPGSTANPSFWQILWAEYTDRGDQEFFFDNFRIVKEN